MQESAPAFLSTHSHDHVEWRRSVCTYACASVPWSLHSHAWQPPWPFPPAVSMYGTQQNMADLLMILEPSPSSLASGAKTTAAQPYFALLYFWEKTCQRWAHGCNFFCRVSIKSIRTKLIGTWLSVHWHWSALFYKESWCILLKTFTHFFGFQEIGI